MTHQDVHERRSSLAATLKVATVEFEPTPSRPRTTQLGDRDHPARAARLPGAPAPARGRAVRLPRRRRRAAAAGVDPLLLPRPRLDRRARAGRAQRRHRQQRRPRPARRSSIASVRDEIDEEERRVRLPGGEAVQQGPAGTDHRASCCARARSPAGPGCTCAPTARELGGDDDDRSPNRDPRRIKLLRLERLAPAVLLVLFDGVPAVVHIEEPRQGDPVRRAACAAGRRRRTSCSACVDARDADDRGDDVDPSAHDAGAVPARRAGRPRPAANSTQALLSHAAARTWAPTVDGAEFALQMLRFPYRQVFGDPSVGGGAAARGRVPADDRPAQAAPRHASRRGCAMSHGFDPDDRSRAMVIAALERRSSAPSRRSTPSAHWDRRCARDAACWCRSTCRRSTSRPAARADGRACRFALTTPDGAAPAPMPTPFDDGAPRPAGVHLHWAMPDALLRGELRRRRRPSNRLALPPLPDRWVVLRLLVPNGATRAARSRLGDRGRHDQGACRSPTGRPAPRDVAAPAGRSLSATSSPARVGGSLNWVGVYDATPTASRSTTRSTTSRRRAAGVDGDQAAYLVAGWWSRSDARSARRRADVDQPAQQRSHQLGWALIDDREGGDSCEHERAIEPVKQRDARPADATPLRRRRVGELRGSALRRGRSARPSSPSPAGTFKPTASQFVDEAPTVVADRAALAAIDAAARRRPRRAGRAAPACRPAAARRRRRHRPRRARRRRRRRARVAAASATADRRRGARASGCSPRSPATCSIASAPPTALVDVEEHEHAAGLRVAARRRRRDRSRC